MSQIPLNDAHGLLVPERQQQVEVSGTTPANVMQVEQVVASVVGERPTREGMLAFMDEAAKIVASWPQWKREVLRDPPVGIVVAEHR